MLLNNNVETQKMKAISTEMSIDFNKLCEKITQLTTETYEAFKKWMIDLYTSPDVILAHCDQYNCTKQNQGATAAAAAGARSTRRV